MDIRDIKMEYREWNKFNEYIIGFDDYNVLLGISIILFDMNKRETTFNDIVKTIESYHKQMNEKEEIEDIYLERIRLSSVDPIFFQKFAKDMGIELDDYQEQANVGAFHYCTEFVCSLYHTMEEDGLFINENK